jgi:hypothetical protein
MGEEDHARHGKTRGSCLVKSLANSGYLACLLDAMRPPGRDWPWDIEPRPGAKSAMGTQADLWIMAASIVAWLAIIVIVAMFADKAATFHGD